MLQNSNIAVPPFAESNFLNRITKKQNPKTTEKVSMCHNSSLSKTCKIKMSEPEMKNTGTANDSPLKLSSAVIEHTVSDTCTLATVVIPGIVISN